MELVSKPDKNAGRSNAYIPGLLDRVVRVERDGLMDMNVNCVQRQECGGA